MVLQTSGNLLTRAVLSLCSKNFVGFILLSIFQSTIYSYTHVVYKPPIATSCIQNPDFEYDYSTGGLIQQAINAAINGDEIIICAGTYTEELTINSKSLTISGVADPRDAEIGSRTILSRDASYLNILSIVNNIDDVVTLNKLEFLGSTTNIGRGLSVIGGTINLNEMFFEGNNLGSGSGGVEEDVGGALFLKNTISNISNTEFFDNHSDAAGGAIHQVAEASCVGELNLNQSVIILNGSAVGGGVSTVGSASCILPVVISDVVFIENNVWGAGGGIYATNSNINIFEVDLMGNSVITGPGGAIQSGLSEIVISNSYFTRNFAGIGGAADIHSSSIDFTDNILESNYSTHLSAGGSTLNFSSLTGNPKIKKSIFFNNNTGSCAGEECSILRYISTQTMEIENSLFFFNNTSKSVVKGNFNVRNSTFYNNLDNGGGAFTQLNLLESNEVSNSIIWMDDLPGLTSTSLVGPISTNVSHSIIKDGYTGGIEIYDTGLKVEKSGPVVQGQPGLLDILNFSLDPLSKVGINQGSNALSVGSEDLAGNPRVQHGTVDIGAYELQSLPKFSIIVTSEGNGFVAPVDDGNVLEIESGQDATFTFFYGTGIKDIILESIGDVPIFKNDYLGKGYELKKYDFSGSFLPGVLVDGVPQQVQDSPINPIYKTFTFINVTADHTLHAEFVIKEFDVTVTVSGQATLPIPGIYKINYDGYFSINLEPIDGSQVSEIIVDQGLATEKIYSNFSENIFVLENVRENKTIHVVFIPCPPREEIEPNYFTLKSYLTDDGLNPISTYIVPNGFGKVVQRQVQLNSSQYMATGAYSDGLFRNKKLIKPFLYDNSGGFKYIEMCCENLVTEANQYFNGTNGEKDAQGYAFTQFNYKPNPLGKIDAVGGPGVDFSLHPIAGHHPRAWSFGIPSDDVAEFLSPEELSEAQLDALNFLEGDYVLKVFKDPNNKYSQFITDKNGNLLKSWVLSNAGTGETIIQEQSYDALGQLETERPDMPNLESEYSYDSYGAVTREKTPDYGEVLYTFDEAGRLILLKNEKHKILDQNELTFDHYTKMEYDDIGRLEKILEVAIDLPGVPVQSDVKHIKIQYIYDYFDAQQIKDLNLESDNIYLTNTMIDVIVSELSFKRGLLAAEISYAEDGEKKVVDIYSYDSREFLDKRFKLLPSDIPVQKFEYLRSTIGQPQEIHYFSDYISDAWQQEYYEKYNYDNLGRVSSIERTKPGQGSPEKLVEYVYSNRGVMTEEKIYAYGNSSPIKTISYDYNIREWPTEISTSGTDSYFKELINYGALYNGNTNSVTYRYKTPGNAEQVFDFTYTYDGADRLTSIISPQNSDFESLYAHDKAGRLIRKKEGSTDYAEYHYADGSNQLTHLPNETDPDNSLKNYIYDPNGNVVMDRSKNMTIDYDWRDMPVKFRIYQSIPAQEFTWEQVKDNGLAINYSATLTMDIEVLYDASNQRISKFVINLAEPGNSAFAAYVDQFSVFEGSNFDEFGNPGTITLDYVNFQTLSGYKGRQSFSGSLDESYYLTDTKGSVRAQLDATGTLQHASMYHGYGNIEEVYSGAAKNSREKYSGKEFDQSTALYYYGFRYFNPEVGNWTSPDPLQQFHNGYSFVGGDPINFIDPWGLEGEDNLNRFDGEKSTACKLQDCGGTATRKKEPVKEPDTEDPEVDGPNDKTNPSNPNLAFINSYLTENMKNPNRPPKSILNPDGLTSQELRQLGWELMAQGGGVWTSDGELVVLFKDQKLFALGFATLLSSFVVPDNLWEGFGVGSIKYVGGGLSDAVKATKSAFRVAKEGGRHAGQLKQFMKQTPQQLQKTIKSFDKQISRHQNWIKNPASKVKNFNQLSKQHQNNLIHHWTQDIARHQELRSIASDVLKGN